MYIIFWIVNKNGKSDAKTRRHGDANRTKMTTILSITASASNTFYELFKLDLTCAYLDQYIQQQRDRFCEAAADVTSQDSREARLAMLSIHMQRIINKYPMCYQITSRSNQNFTSRQTASDTISQYTMLYSTQIITSQLLTPKASFRAVVSDQTDTSQWAHTTG